MRATPMALGEALHFLPNLGLHVRVAATPFLYVRFGVHPTRFLVFVINCAASARLQ